MEAEKGGRGKGDEDSGAVEDESMWKVDWGEATVVGIRGGDSMGGRREIIEA